LLRSDGSPRQCLLEQPCLARANAGSQALRSSRSLAPENPSTSGARDL
jgi:hypothetical protein